MSPLRLLMGVANFANPVYKIAVSAVMFYTLYHRHKQFKAENDRRKHHPTVDYYPSREDDPRR